MGVVRQAVKRSAGRLGFMGSNSLDPQAASRMQFSSSPTQFTWVVFWRRNELVNGRNMRFIAANMEEYILDSIDFICNGYHAKGLLTPNYCGASWLPT